MRPTISYIRDTFAKYNDLAFGGSLPEPPFFLVASKTFGRTCGWERRMPDGSSVRGASIKISLRYVMPEEEYIDTIVHEMIHYYIWMNRLQDDGSHGHLFLSMMNDISRKCGIRISVAGEITEEMLLQEPARLRYICVAVFENGQVAMSVVPRGKLFQLWDAFDSVKEISSVTWYASSDPFFGQFPTTVSPRLLGIDGGALFPHLESAVDLENTGHTIRPRNTSHTK